MSQLKKYNVKASSITESVIAMTIVAICLAIAMFTYGSVLQTDNNVTFFIAQQKVKELLYETKKNNQVKDENYDYESFTIQKTVKELDNNSFAVDFIVTTVNKKNRYQYIVSY